MLLDLKAFYKVETHLLNILTLVGLDVADLVDANGLGINQISVGTV